VRRTFEKRIGKKIREIRLLCLISKEENEIT
jgi:hypothetical protein